MLAMVGLVAVVLVIAGIGSLILTHAAARNQATQQLVSEANSLTSAKSGVQSLRELRTIRSTLALEDADFIRINSAGTITTPLPHGLTASDIDVAALQAGETVSGQKGNLVYAIAPADLSTNERVRLNFGGTLGVLLTRDVGGLGPSWVYFIVAGGVALLVAALVAWQMSRRMARPLEEAVEVTGRIASGELASRVQIRPGDYPEFSSLAGSINHMAQSLDDSRARERHLLLAVSHDLRTPLTSIRGFAEAINDGAVDDSGQAADVIIAESRRLERLVGDLLDLTKLEAHQMSIALRPTDAVEVATTTAEGFRPAAAKSQVNIVVGAPGDARLGNDGPGAAGTAPTGAIPPVSADPDRLAQLLANLLENAITFASSEVTVTVRDDRRAGACVIGVEDDGPGIAEGDLDRVFERFYRADRGPNRRIGSGLGLAIVSELASAMGGTVRAESPLTADGGSRFVVTLDHWPAPAPAVAQTT
jgi:signal transduction histidine kinase